MSTAEHRNSPPQTLVTLFGPLRWCRRHWSSLWFRLAAAGALLLVAALVLGSLSDTTGGRSWDNWLANFQIAGSGGRAANARIRQSSEKPRLGRPVPLPAYLGEGRAELGDYNVRMFDPITQCSLRSEFRLEGQTTLGDEGAFQEFMGRKQRFFREQVAVVLRTYNPNELDSPNLDLLGRKIVARVNRSLGERVLNSVEVKDFALYESVDR